MARFNSSLISNTITGTTSVGSPFNGSFTALTGTAPYTVTLANPTLFPGINQQFYNSTSGTVTLSTPAGNFTGAGGSATSTFPVYAGNVVSVTADGTNYIVISEDGSALTATSATISGVLTVQSSGGVAIAPSTTGNIDNVNVGATTRGSGAFNTLTANNAVTFTANTASSTTGTGTVVITGGLGVSGTINATSVSASLTGTIQTAAQANITSVGALTSLGVGASPIANTKLTVTASSGSLATFQQTGATGYGLTVIPGADTSYDAFTINNAANTLNQIRMFGNGNATFAGSVGIGTASPTNKLTVDGQSNDANSSKTGANILIGTEYGLRQRGSSAGISGIGYAAQLYSTSSGGPLEVYSSGATNPLVFGTNSTERMRIDSSGSVLLGTTTDPIYGTFPRPTLSIKQLNDSGSGFTAIHIEASADQSVLGIGYNGDVFSFNTSYRNTGGYRGISFNPGNTEKMRIKPDGNVGIGTTNPLAKLHVLAGANNASIRIGDENNNGSASTFYYPALSYYGRRDNVQYTGNPLTNGSGSTASIVFTDRPGTGGYASVVRTSDIQFYTSTNSGGTGLDPAPTIRMSITAEGNVGINNSNPTYKLDIGVNSGQTTTSGAGGNIRNSTAADTAPYTQARITIYGDTNVDTGNWAYLAYGSDAVARFVYAKTGSASGQLSFGTSSATNGTGTYTEMMRMNNNGVMTLTNQPAFYAVGAGGSTAYGNAGEFILASVQTNRGSHYSSSTGRFTAPVAGFYSFTYAIYSYAGAAQQISFKKNGSDWVVGDTSGLNTVASNYIGGTGFMLYLAANDTASFGWRNGYSGNIYHGHTWFSGHLVG